MISTRPVSYWDICVEFQRLSCADSERIEADISVINPVEYDRVFIGVEVLLDDHLAVECVLIRL